jgi:hypothetical protein
VFGARHKYGRSPSGKLLTLIWGENRHQPHRASAAGPLIVDPFKTKITGLAIAYE